MLSRTIDLCSVNNYPGSKKNLTDHSSSTVLNLYKKNMANTEKCGNDESKKLQELDESLRTQYMDILESLSINELKRFDNTKYKTLVKSEIFEILPNPDKVQVDETAQYISNMLGNEAPMVKVRKIQLQTKTQNGRRTRSSTSNNEIISNRNDKRGNQALIIQKEDETISNRNDNDPLSETFLNDLDNTFNLQMDTTILKKQQNRRPFLRNYYNRIGQHVFRP